MKLESNYIKISQIAPASVIYIIYIIYKNFLHISIFILHHTFSKMNVVDFSGSGVLPTLGLPTPTLSNQPPTTLYQNQHHTDTDTRVLTSLYDCLVSRSLHQLRLHKKVCQVSCWTINRWSLKAETCSSFPFHLVKPGACFSVTWIVIESEDDSSHESILLSSSSR